MRIVLEPETLTFLDDVGEEIVYALTPRQYELALSVIYDNPCFGLGSWDPYENAVDYFCHYMKDARKTSERRKEANRPNPNNCETCAHKQNPDGGHCYMFSKAPTEVCMQHTGRKNPFMPFPDTEVDAHIFKAVVHGLGLKGLFI